MIGASQPASRRRCLISATGCGGFGHVHGDAHQFRAGLRQFLALLRGAGDVGRVGVGHRLDDDRRAAADLNLADFHANRCMSFPWHWTLL